MILSIILRTQHLHEFIDLYEDQVKYCTQLESR